MQLQTHPWENALLLRAYEAHHPVSTGMRSQFSQGLLERAYAHCDSITAYHSKSFYLASSLLSPPKRRAVRALYAFCRVTDDIVDCGIGQREARLELWRDRVMDPEPPAEDSVAVAWTDARLRFNIPPRYVEQLIDGVAQDLTPRAYETFADLAAYSYGVASTVGLMSMHIIGYTTRAAIPYAIKLGVALQITNILRDIGADLRCGRVYLPQEDLAAFGIDRAELAAGRVSTRWREFMRFQIERNRRLYAEAIPGIRYLNQDGRLAIRAAAELYAAILGEIEAADYDVFDRRAAVSTFGKISRLPGIWWRTQILP